MSDHTAPHTGANQATANTAAPAEAWRAMPHRATLNVTSHDAFSQIIVQVINQQMDHEGIPPSAARDARVAELIARTVQAQFSRDHNARVDSARRDSARGSRARGSRIRGSRARGQGRGNGRGGYPDRTPRAERIHRRGAGHYGSREAERTRRRGDSRYYYAARDAAREAERSRRPGGSGYYPAREAGRIARDRRGGRVAINGRGAVNGRSAVNGVPGHQAARAPAANNGPQWYTRPQTGLDEMTDVDAP